MIPELVELNDFRLAEDLTYRELEQATGISYRTLFNLLTSDEPRPYDRTLHKIRRFLNSRKAPSRRKRA